MDFGRIDHAARRTYDQKGARSACSSLQLPPRSMVGQLTLDQHIGVRIPGGQPNKTNGLPSGQRTKVLKAAPMPKSVSSGLYSRRNTKASAGYRRNLQPCSHAIVLWLIQAKKDREPLSARQRNSSRSCLARFDRFPHRRSRFRRCVLSSATRTKN